ncbi:class I SAM-dependent DNA methyltransferase [Caldalkalibacillus mannanilyticus]|uniref:class I SAM-dependent DNA methyltransferase n=1 Tax=Caldalkalibacillus mannanilyticus TaxID=1418 RepID=UPI000468DC84|nr:class I SAM-dependent methyltransferase [Caldalkalibacillus mannanilyticus]
MEKYGHVFATIYNNNFSQFADDTFTQIYSLIEQQEISLQNKNILDLCCGTGRLSLHFLRKGFNVTGIDISEHMLTYAMKNAEKYIEAGQAQFILGDATNFALDQHYSLIVSTYDALNHLENDEALQSCFKCVYDVLEEKGTFVFDLNTRLALTTSDGLSVHEDQNSLFITKRQYHPSFQKACTVFSGFVKQKNNDTYVRFQQIVYNTIFELDKVKNYLLDIGWSKVDFTLSHDLNQVLKDPESVHRVFVIAKK